MLSIVIVLTLQKKLHITETNNVILDKHLTTQQQNKKQEEKSLPEPETEPGTSRTAVWCVINRIYEKTERIE